MTARKTSYVQRAIAELRLVLREPGAAISTPAAVKDWCVLHLAGLQREEFHMLTLDSQHRMIGSHRLFVGTLTQTAVYPREVLRTALIDNAGAVILAHNHPSGTVQPSAADRLLTDSLKSALAMIDVRVLDHIIVGGVDTLSFAERGWC